MAIVKESLAIVATPDTPKYLNFTRGSTATRVNEIGLIELVESNKIRYDYKSDVPGSTRGWLIEETSTNVCSRSEDFNTSWVYNLPNGVNVATVADNQTISPDGNQTADTLSASSTADNKIIGTKFGTTAANESYITYSVFAKKKDHDFLEISNDSGATAGHIFSQVFNISNGTIPSGGASGNVYAAHITKHISGWYRCEVTFQYLSGKTPEMWIKSRPDNVPAANYSVITGHGTYLWGAQMEGNKYATSYIPTDGSSLQRAADNAWIDNTEGKWGSGSGLSIQITATPLNTTEEITPIYHYQDTDNSDYISLMSDASISVVSNEVPQLDANPFTPGGTFSTSRHQHFRSIISIKDTYIHTAFNGSLSPNFPKSGPGVSTPVNNSSSAYTIKFFSGSGATTIGSGWLESFKLYPNALDDFSIQSKSMLVNITPTEVAQTAIMVVDGSITGMKLASEAVSSEKIGPAAITAPKMAPDSVVEACIVDGAVTENKIAANSITSAHLKVDVIVAEDIAANAITVSELQDNAVVKAKIADNSVDIAKLDVTDGSADLVLKTDGAGNLVFSDTVNVSGASVGGDVNGTVGSMSISANKVGITELNVADGSAGQVLTTNGAGVLSFTSDATDVSGTGVGGDLSGTVNNAQIQPNTISSVELQSNAVTANSLANNAVDTDAIIDLNVTTTKLADLNVTTGKLANISVTDIKLANHATLDANRAVGTDHIKNLNVTDAKLAIGAVTSTKLGANAVDAAALGLNSVASENIINGAIVEVDLADNAVATNKIDDTAVTDAKLASNSVTHSKIADLNVLGTKIANSSITIAKLACADGSAGQVLTTNGAGVLSFSTDSTNVGATAVGGDVTGTVSNITIPTGAITSDMLGVNVIVAEDVANNAITIAELNVNSVDLSKLVVTGGAPTAGQILSHDGNGDFTWVDDTDTTIGDAAVGGMVSGTISNVSIAAGVVTPTMLSATGTANNTTFLRGDGVWATPVTVEVDPTAVTMAIALG